MADENNQEQNTPENQESQTEAYRTQSLADGTDPDKPVPYSRLAQSEKQRQQEKREKRELQQKLDQIEAQAAKEEEERAKARGEWEKVASKHKQQAEKEKQLRIAAEKQLVRYKQLQTWREAARGIILDEAIDHAFDDLPSDDLAGIEETDVDGMARLAEMLADSRSYYAAGPRGAGSGFGSRTPVLERPTARTQPQTTSTKNIFAGKRKRRPWK